LPDQRGRLPVHQGNGFILAESGGAEEITLTVSQIAAHGHPLLAVNGLGNDPNPQSNLLAESSVVSMYQSGAANVAMAPASVSQVGGSQPHTNFQPYLCVNFIISLFGIFPSPT
jgi:microcystin-dependent protein